MSAVSETQEPWEAADNPPGKAHTALMAGFIGNVVEWYDFALYGYMATILSGLFFPSHDRLASLLATYGVFAAGFLMRPLGSAVFGWLGDTVGRSATMMISVSMMALPTFAIGILPTYETAGLWAPALLVVIRLIQGLSVGGEFSSSVTYLVETAPPAKRGFAGSFANIGSIVGMLLGSGVAAALTTLLPMETILAWAWRLPFIFGAVIGISAILLRRHLPRSEHFREHCRCRAETSPLVEAFTENLDQTLKATLFASAYGVVFYFALVYLPNWASEEGGYPLELAMQVNTFATAGLLLLIPIAGWVSDRWVRRTRVVAIAMAAMALLAYPLFQWMARGGVPALLVSQGALAVLLALPLGAAPAMFVEMFPARDRLSGYSVSYNVGLGIIGGATPMIATALIDFSGVQTSPALFLTAAALTGLAAMLWIRDRSREPLR